MLRRTFKTEKRGYTILLEEDLLGDFILQRHWFGLKTKRHGQKIEIFSDKNYAIKKIEAIAKNRICHGYKEF